jgi:hypothetical protein
VVSNSKFNLYWDYEVMGGQEESELGRQLNDVLQKENKNEISEANTKRLSLLNILYEFRTLDNFDSFFEELLRQPFLGHCLDKADQSKPAMSGSLFSNEDLIQFSSSSLPVIDDYQRRIEEFKDIRKKLGLYQELIKETLPLEYARVTDSHTKELIYNYSKKAKQDYVSLLNEYNRDFVERDQPFTGYEYKHMNNELIYDASEPLTQRDQQTKPQNDMRIASISNIIRLKLLSGSNSSKLAVAYANKLKDGTFLVNKELAIPSYDVTIGSLFTEADYAFFETYLPHSQLRDAKNLSVNDLLITLGMMVDSKRVSLLEMDKYMTEHYQGGSQLDSDSKAAVLSLFTTQIDNGTKFSHDFARRSVQQMTKQVKDQDLQTFEDVFCIIRIKVIRLDDTRLLLA